MRWSSFALFALLFSACGDNLPCAETANLVSGSATLSTGTPVDVPFQLNPRGCDVPLSLAAELEERPAGSTASIVPTGDTLRLLPDVPGRYVIRISLGVQSATMAITAIPDGGFEEVLSPVPCYRAAIGASSIACAEVNTSGLPYYARLYRKADFGALEQLGFATSSRPGYGSGRYFFLRSSLVSLADEGADGQVGPPSIVSLGYTPYGPSSVSMATSGGRALVLDLDGRLRLIDAADPAGPQITEVAWLPFFGAQRMAFSGNIAAVVGQTVPETDVSVEIALLDVTSPSTPAMFVSAFPFSVLAFSGPRLVAAHDGGLDVYDVTLDRGPLLAARNPDANGFAVAATADRIAVVNAYGVLLVSPLSLKPQVFIPAPGTEQVLLDEDRVYTVGAGVLRVFRVAL
jgi:hypothetical protein